MCTPTFIYVCQNKQFFLRISYHTYQNLRVAIDMSKVKDIQYDDFSTGIYKVDLLYLIMSHTVYWRGGGGGNPYSGHHSLIFINFP